MKMIQEKYKGFATVLAYAIAPLSGIAVDLYSPSLPAMARDLHVSVLNMQASVSIYLVFYGISQLFVGILLDSFGRHRLNLISLLIFSLSSFAIAAIPNIHVIYILRAIQGVSIGIVLVAKRAFLVDMFNGDKLKHALSVLTIVWSIGPITAPFIGGYLQTSFGWKYNFYFLGAASMVGFILDWIFSGETLHAPAKFHFRQIAANYSKMLGTFDFILSITLSGLAYGVAMIFTLTSPFLIEHTFHYNSVTVGYSLLVVGLGWLSGNLLGKALIKIDLNKKIFIANIVQFTTLALMILFFRIAPNLYTLIGFTFFIVMASAFIFNNSFTYSLSRFPKMAGIAGGLVGGFTYILLSGITYLLLLFIPVTELMSLAWYDLILVGGISIVFVSFVRGRRKQVALKSASCPG
ncbi:MFS transporter [Prolixibacter denitrificans]|uniref:Bcr/CflA family drug resistance efflux transporter n=1 Tax=Prolixibacter denitrificans TaxID=1541063 RepID=A0A2P8CFK0_9BACT|nr:MFS transporter [Prolixibacter denitrificans]PSK83702.1 multidrug resistance protein [Prolixibacter denitrificans]GET23246.1 Bcr/CflA family drug resistance efflux transporter [Prolixibacter denitrificans]